jgi:hypothetical protein
MHEKCFDPEWGLSVIYGKLKLMLKEMALNHKG